MYKISSNPQLQPKPIQDVITAQDFLGENRWMESSNKVQMNPQLIKENEND